MNLWKKEAIIDRNHLTEMFYQIKTRFEQKNLEKYSKVLKVSDVFMFKFLLHKT